MIKELEKQLDEKTERFFEKGYTDWLTSRTAALAVMKYDFDKLGVGTADQKAKFLEFYEKSLKKIKILRKNQKNDESA